MQEKLSIRILNDLDLGFKWNDRNIFDVEEAEIFVEHGEGEYRIIGTILLENDFNTTKKKIKGFSYAHNILYEKPPINNTKDLEKYNDNFKALIEFSKKNEDVKICTSILGFITLVKEFSFVRSIDLNNFDFHSMELRILRMLVKWINKILKYTYENDELLIKKSQFI
ncbi:MAG: hypothetical protein ACTSVY_03435 [Candidatus Helarchaeota archaeon]